MSKDESKPGDFWYGKRDERHFEVRTFLMQITSFGQTSRVVAVCDHERDAIEITDALNYTPRATCPICGEYRTSQYRGSERCECGKAILHYQ